MSFRKMALRPWRWLAALVLLGLVLALPRWLIERKYAPRIMAPADLSDGDVALVFGAGLSRSGLPSPVLADRVRTAASLFQSGKVQRLLLSGSAGAAGYDEPQAMRQLALSLGVPPESILLDHSGNRTFESCRQARYAFGLQQAVLVTQRFHLPRALATCDSLGLKALGVSADQRRYGLLSQVIWQVREVPATLRALWDGLGASSPDLAAPQVGRPERELDAA
jgi:SanA protein